MTTAKLLPVDTYNSAVALGILKPFASIFAQVTGKPEQKPTRITVSAASVFSGSKNTIVHRQAQIKQGLVPGLAIEIDASQKQDLLQAMATVNKTLPETEQFQIVFEN